MTVNRVSGAAPAAAAPNRFCVGLDLGRQVDPSALALLQWHSEPAPRPVAFAPPPLPSARPVYEVPTLARWPMGTSYREIVKAVARFFKAPPLCVKQPVLVIDATGVGAAVAEMVLGEMIEAGAPGFCCEVTITAGAAVTHRQDRPGAWNVAKKAIASTLQAVLGTRRLLISNALPEARTLKDELGKFTVKITEALNETYEAWRENEHDDLVLAVGLAAWGAENLDHFKNYPAQAPPARPRA